MGLARQELAGLFQLFGERLFVAPMFERMVLPGILLSSSFKDSAGSKITRIVAGDSPLVLADPSVSMDWKVGTITEHESILDGALSIVRFAHPEADLIVVAHDPGGQEVVAYIEGTAGGIFWERLESADPGVPIAALRLERVRAAAVLRGADATRCVQAIRSWARLLAAAELTGIARRALDMALAYIVERKQFGVPIATFQAVRHMAASATQRVVELESMVEAIASGGVDTNGAGLELTAMSYKALASELARTVVEDSIQMHGGIGFTYEYDLHWYYKKVLALRAWYGDEIELYGKIGQMRLAG